MGPLGPTCQYWPGKAGDHVFRSHPHKLLFLFYFFNFFWMKYTHSLSLSATPKNKEAFSERIHRDGEKDGGSVNGHRACSPGGVEAGGSPRRGSSGWRMRGGLGGAGQGLGLPNMHADHKGRFPDRVRTQLLLHVHSHPPPPQERLPLLRPPPHPQPPLPQLLAR